MNEQAPHLTLVRRYAAPPDRVWAAWTDPELVVQWFGPDAGPVLEAELDVREGGRFRIVFQSEDGETHTCLGTYIEAFRTSGWLSAGSGSPCPSAVRRCS